MEIAKEELMKATILESAKGLFQKYGLAKTTMEDIAKSIGKGKSTLYYYFATKEDIFEAVLLQEKASMIAQIQNAIDGEETAKGKLKAFASTIIEAIKKKTGLHKVSLIQTLMLRHVCASLAPLKRNTIILNSI